MVVQDKIVTSRLATHLFRGKNSKSSEQLEIIYQKIIEKFKFTKKDGHPTKITMDTEMITRIDKEIRGIIVDAVLVVTTENARVFEAVAADDANAEIFADTSISDIDASGPIFVINAYKNSDIVEEKLRYHELLARVRANKDIQLQTRFYDISDVPRDRHGKV